MPRQRRTFTPEFKLQMVKLYENGKSRADIAYEYDLTPSFTTKDNRTDAENELEKLRKENQRLLMGNDILKQAALIMGRK